MLGVLSIVALSIKEAVFFVSLVKKNSFPKPLNEDEETANLTLMRDGDPLARNLLIEHNLRLVAHISKKFDSTGESNEDLISIGTIGLIKAIESYLPDKGTKLATYASRCIENEMLMHLRCTKKSKKDVSLHDPIGKDKDGNEITLIDILSTDEDETAQKVQDKMEKTKLHEYIHVLDPREREVISLRFGLTNKNEKTQRQIAKELGISRSYVSRIEKRALIKLFHQLYRTENAQNPYHLRYYISRHDE